MWELRFYGWRASLLTLAGLFLAGGDAWAQSSGGQVGGGQTSGSGAKHPGGIGHGFGGFQNSGTTYGGFHYGGVGYSSTSYGVLGFRQGTGYGLGVGKGYGPGTTSGGHGFSFSGGYPNYGSAYGNRSTTPSNGGGYNYGSSYPGISGSLGRLGYSPPPQTQPTPSSGYGSAAGQQAPPKDDLAHLLLIVPENAELWFNDTKSKQTGAQREFVSPQLSPGKRYRYEVKARWMADGKPVEEVRRVRVQANTWQTVDFTKPEARAANTKE